jgi:hypothetical protein
MQSGSADGPHEEVWMSFVHEGGAASPGIARVLKIRGGLTVLAGVAIAIIGGFPNDPSIGSAGIGVALSSVFFFGFAAIIERLHRIEYNTRAKG